MTDLRFQFRQLIDTIESARINNEQAEQWQAFFEREKNEEYRQVSCLFESNRLAREALGLSRGIK
jgi:hypothetical protein